MQFESSKSIKYPSRAPNIVRQVASYQQAIARVGKVGIPCFLQLADSFCTWLRRVGKNTTEPAKLLP